MGGKEETTLPALDINTQTIADVLRQQPTSRLRKFLYLDSYVDFLKKKKYLMKLFSELHSYVKLTRVEDKRRIMGIEMWLEKADNVLKDVQSLENEVLEETEKSLKCCPDWLWQFKLRKKVAKKSRDITQLLMNCRTNFGYWVPSSSSTIFKASKAWDTAYKNIMEALNDNDVSIVAICGMGGVGKTTLAKEVGKKALQLELFDEVVLVHLGDEMSNHEIIDKIQRYLAMSLNLQFSAGEDRAQQLRARLENIQCVLIILDNVWEKPCLEEIGIPYGKDHGGCKILLTTSRKQVCSSMKRERAVELDILDEEDAWFLFQEAVGLSNSHQAGIDNCKLQAGKKVTKECHGLPCLLLAAGRFLKERPVEEWKLEWESDETIKETTGVDAFDSVHRSFYELRSKETKICLLLCSLFPKGSAINVEDLLKYAIGLGLYQEIESLEEVRGKVLHAIEDLKTCYLLLERGGKNVEMNGLVHEYALLTASKGTQFSEIARQNDSYSMTIEPPVDIDNSSLYESFENCTAVFVTRRTELPNVVSPKLEILLFSGDKDCYKISRRRVLENTEALRGLIPRGDDALQPLKNLRTLHLEYCQFVDFSSLGALINLKIISFRSSDISQLPHEMASLKNLRMLDLYDCQKLEMVPSDLIQNLSHLEELCIGGPSFQQWPFKKTSLDGKNASPPDLKSLPFLNLLSLDIPSVRIPEVMVFPSLQKYQIAINDSKLHHLYPLSRALKVTDDFSLSAVRELLCNVQYLLVDGVKGDRNLVPDSDIGGLNELTLLKLRHCHNMKCIIDNDKKEIVLDSAFSELKELIIEEMSCLNKLCNGPPTKGFLQKLKTLTVTNCANIIFIAPEVQSLEELRVRNCGNLQAVFQNDGVLHTSAPLLSCLRYLELINLPELMCVWKQPISHVSLQSLQKVLITDCGGMTTLFSSSLAQSLEKLETLKIRRCRTLKQIAEFANETSSDNQFKPPSFPSLTTLEIADCDALECIFPISADGLLQLRELDISGCKQLKHVFTVMDANAVKLPRLRRLVFKELTILSTFDSSGNSPVQLRVLQQLKVEACPCLTNFTISSEASGQVRLEELYLSNVGDKLSDTAILRRDALSELEHLTIGNNEEIFQIQGGYFLSKLKKLILQKLAKLQVLWKAEMQIVTLQNLSYLEVSECNNLTSIFSLVLAQNLPLLTYFKVKACDKLEQIISQNQISSSSTIHLKSNCFPRLTEICIEDCNKLTSLFPVALARLPRLKKFMVTGASNLRQIFGHENEEKVSSTRKKDEKDVKKDEKDVRSDEEEIVLPQLEELVLKNLPELISFTPLGYYFVLRSLRALNVHQCGKMIMKFITYDSEPRYVRAQIEVSSWPQQKRAEINPELGRDIDWHGYGQGNTSSDELEFDD